MANPRWISAVKPRVAVLDFWDRDGSCAICWDDPDLAIAWLLEDVSLRTPELEASQLSKKEATAQRG